MTKDEIYEHLAKVYLGKKKKKKKAASLKFFLLIFLNVAAIISAGSLVFYGIKAQGIKTNQASNNIYFYINQFPLRLKYNFNEPFPQIENFSLPLPEVDLRPYKTLEFSMKSGREAMPEVLKITLENKKKEVSSYFLKPSSTKWQKISIPLKEFKEITDWSDITKVHFVFEAWNTGKKRGSVLVDNICFAN